MKFLCVREPQLDPVPRGLLAVGLTYLLCVAALDVLVLTAPLPVLLDRFIPDDAFYYFNTARVFAQTGFSSFDGLHFTNGYQPLWFLMNVPVYWLFPNGGEIPLRLILFAQVPLSIVASVILVRTIAKSFGTLSAGIVTVVWIVVFQPVMLDGLETALQMALYSIVVDLFARLYVQRKVEATPRRLMLLGFLSGLLFLARTDSIFLLVPLGLYLLGRAFRTSPTAPHTGWQQLFAWAVPVVVFATAYLATNLITTGHLMPVSGAAKQYHSELARLHAIQAGASSWHVYWDNLIWPFREPGYRFVGVALAAPWLLMILRFFRPLKPLLSPAQHFWPFYLGTLGLYLYYSLVFYGGFTRTLWYYGPAAFWSCFAIAGFTQVLDVAFPLTRIPGLAAVFLVGLVLNWINIPTTAIVLAVALAVAFLTEYRPPSRGPAHPATLIVMTLAAVGIMYVRGISLQSWLPVIASTILLGAVLFGEALTSLAWLTQLVGVVVLMSSAIHGTNLRTDLTAPPGYWNYNLYLGAMWARDHLPPDATIWSGSAGILGYFSGRTVVNTDGLANSYDFLDQVLKAGRLAEYVSQWDYAIDAFPDEDLAKWLPAGCFVPLPVKITQYSFADGSLTRQVRVYQMKPSGVVECSSVP